MQRWRGFDAVPAGWGRCVVTIGVYDGVHRGHQVTLGQVVDRARDASQPAVVVTFDPHPLAVLRGVPPPMLTYLTFKASLLEALDIDALCVVPFTKSFSRLEPDEFVHHMLVENLHADAVVVGANFRFGYRAQGDVDLLVQLGREYGFSVHPIELAGDADTTWSSTYIRSCVEAGAVEEAAEALSRPHRIDGVVVRGDRRGRELGFPTANLEPLPFTAVPGDGVYAGWLYWGDESLPAAISIGTNPTFEGRERRIEAFVLDRDDLDLYGMHAGFGFVGRLRDTIRFDSVDALLTQMTDDVKQARALLSR
jgi:riboflavin kinase / FMN adenylyltransferase